jgi:hypothetical protein
MTKIHITLAIGIAAVMFSAIAYAQSLKPTDSSAQVSTGPRYVLFQGTYVPAVIPAVPAQPHIMKLDTQTGQVWTFYAGPRNGAYVEEWNLVGR